MIKPSKRPFIYLFLSGFYTCFFRGDSYNQVINTQSVIKFYFEPRLFMNIRKSGGPRFDPCVTPEAITIADDL